MNHTDNSCAVMIHLKSNQDPGQSRFITDSAPFSATDANKVEQHMMQSSKASGNLDITTDECKNMTLNKKSEQGTLCDEASEKVSVTPNPEDNAATSSNPDPIPNPIAIPSSSLRRIKITEDLTLLLVPRIKLNFIVCCLGDFYSYLSESDLKFLVTSRFRDSRLFRKKIFVPAKDIHVRYLCPPKMTDDNLEVVAEGSIYVRDPCLNSMELILKCQKILLEKMRTFQAKFNDIAYQVRVFPPAFSEDPCEMMASVSGLTQDPPTIMLKGIPSQWFSDHPDSSEPSKKLLHIFLETFGKVRHLDFVADHEFGKGGRIESEVSSTLYCNVLVQYEKDEDCENALRFLCAHSLLKEGSRMVAHYEVSWKEDLCQNARCHTCTGEVFHEVASEGPLEGDSIEKGIHFATKQRGSADSAPVESTIEGIISGLQQQVEALKHLTKDLRAKDERIAMLEGELEAANL